MITENQIVQLCIKGTQAEYAGRLEDAHAFYWQAWEIANDDYEACVAAHYVARFQGSEADRLCWNQIALDRANAAEHDRVKDFFPSLYVNMGRSYELLGDLVEAQRYYELAASLGLEHTGF